MKRVVAEYPYNDYYLYIVFHKKENRRYANLVSIKDGKKDRKTISYARYLMSVKEKRILNPEEHVDHKDNNKLNDNINNLQILTLKENNIKESIRRGRKMVLLKCPSCGKEFIKRRNQTHLCKGGKYTGCSRKCSSKFGALLQHNPNNKKLLNSLKENVIKEFVEH